MRVGGYPCFIQWDGGLGGTPISLKGWRGRGYPSFIQQGDGVLLFNPMVENRQYSFFSQWSGGVEGTPVSSNMGSRGTSVSPNRGIRELCLFHLTRGTGG